MADSNYSSGSRASRYGGGGCNGSSGLDKILDFSVVDMIQLSKEVFRDLLEGPLSPGPFSSSDMATSASHRVIYDQTTGGLSYDADGTGQGGAVTFASLMNKPADMSATDFFVA
jgi:Ca2+-binding RTX toxin-like protein